MSSSFLEVLKYITIIEDLKYYIPCYLFRGAWMEGGEGSILHTFFLFSYKSTSNKIPFNCVAAFLPSCNNNQSLCTLHFHFVATSKKNVDDQF